MTDSPRGMYQRCSNRTSGASTKLRRIANAIGTNTSRPKYSVPIIIVVAMADATPLMVSTAPRNPALNAGCSTSNHSPKLAPAAVITREGRPNLVSSRHSQHWDSNHGHAG
jgi:hypothetical protein